jgi:uncharacterized membrane protein YhhN
VLLNSVLVTAAALLLFGVLFFEKKENPKGLVPTKTLLSCLFVLAALLQAHPIPRYTHFMIAGLVFALGGDLFLALPQRKMFFLGLVSFLVCHVFYVAAFSGVGLLSLWTGIGVALLCVIGGGIYRWLEPHLGVMKRPVLCYILVITLMMSGAWSILLNGRLNLPARIMVFVGALCFYVSDVFIARDRFMKKAFLNRLIGLPMYYTGQFLLAFSLGFVNYFNSKP